MLFLLNNHLTNQLRCLNQRKISELSTGRTADISLFNVFNNEWLFSNRLFTTRIEDVVLDHEENIEEHTHRTQAKLHEITLQTRPFIYDQI